MNDKALPTAALLLLSLGGCGDVPPNPPPDDPAPLRSTADWPEIRERGVIRFARLAFEDFETLPSQGLSKERYENLAERFARRHRVEPEWVVAPSVEALLAAVEEGRADVAAATLTVTEARRERIAFTVPLTVSREWVIGRNEEGVFGVAAGTAYQRSLDAHFPEAPRLEMPAETTPDEIGERIEAGEIDATIMDEAAARVIVRTWPEIEKLAELPESKRIAWAARRDNPLLLGALDDFLIEHHTVADEPSGGRDWEAIRASGQLRMLTLSSPVTWYLWRGEQLGFEYELMRLFADANDLDLSVRVARDHGELMEELIAGSGDVVAAGWAETPARRERGLLFTSSYMEVQETFVTRDKPIATVGDLAGRAVTVPPSTSYVNTLAGLEGDFEVVELDLPSDRILERVAEGEIGITLVDSHRAQLAATFDPRLLLGLALEPSRRLVWAVAPGRVELRRRLDDFLRAGHRGYDFNVLINKYFVNSRRQARLERERVTDDQLSPWDGIVERVAAREGFDWRLIVSQMYQESGFDPEEVSFAGARGLMQVMPATSRELGVDPDRLFEPEVGIDAGVRYLAWNRERFPNLPPGEQLWFALASYNAGYGHVADGRRLARRLGLDPSLWFGNVEEAMLRLAEPEYAREAVYGYVRGSEVTGYVDGIRTRYRAYLDHFQLLDAVGR